METGIQKAVRLAGNQTALAIRIGVTPQAVQKWVVQGYAPGDRCRAIESELSGEVTRFELNPGVFGEPPAATTESIPAAQSPATLPYDIPNGAKKREAKGDGWRQPIDPTKDLT